MRLVFDIETNGLLPDVDTIHCIAALDLITDHLFVFEPSEVDEGISLLRDAKCLIGHNICGYDIPVIQKLTGVDLRDKPCVDTSAVSRALFTATLRDSDFGRLKSGFPKHLVGRHSLESWGYRLRCHKGEFAKHTDWKTFSPSMLHYCVQDVRLNAKLYQFLADFERVPGQVAMPHWAMLLESRVHGILGEQERHGVRFSVDRALRLVSDLQTEKAKLTEQLQEIFPPQFISKGTLTPKRDNRSRGYAKGATLTRIELRDFNPGSDQQVGERLQGSGWFPQEFTPGGQPKVDEGALAALGSSKLPGVDLLLRYKLVDKRLGQLYEGKAAWLKLVKGGRLHGRVQATGTRTGRMSHSSPNLAQVPRVGSFLGSECRALFGPLGDGFLVGCDASGLELRTLANRMYPYDKGRFAKEVVEGDIHEAMRQASGLHSRNHQKTFTYAMLYGAGATKLGQTVAADLRDAGLPVKLDEQTLGKRTHARLVSKLAGLGDLLDAAKTAHRRGFIRLLNGLYVMSKSEHSALNTLLQGDGAVVMKVAQFHLDEQLRKAGVPFAWNLTVHDEFQIEVPDEESAQVVGQQAVESIRQAGRILSMQVELDAEFSVGRTWEETH